MEKTHATDLSELQERAECRTVKEMESFLVHMVMGIPLILCVTGMFLFFKKKISVFFKWLRKRAYIEP